MNTHTQTLPRGLALAAALVLALGLGACSNMSRQDQNTAVGAGVGAVGGAVLTGGSTSAPWAARPLVASSATRLTPRNKPAAQQARPATARA